MARFPIGGVHRFCTFINAIEPSAMNPFDLSAKSTLPQRPRVVIAADSERYRHELATSFRPQYDVRVVKNLDQLLKAEADQKPEVLVLDEHFLSQGRVAPLARIRRERQLRSVPIVFTTKGGAPGKLSREDANGRTLILKKPFRQSLLRESVSHFVNLGAETEWEHIEPLQRAALQKTLTTFNSIAEAIENGTPILYSEVKASCGPLVEAVRNDNFQNMLKGVQAHDNYTYVHSLRVATFVTLFGKTLGIDGEDLMTLASGGLLHDVGKTSVPLEILNKPGRLDPGEFETIKGHVNHGVEFLSHMSDLPKGVLVIASQHHEKLDGSGYPAGLEGSQLNRLARMASIIDIFGAMTDRRVYKDPFPPETALDQMREMGRQLDQGLLAVFREMLLDAAEGASSEPEFG
jgi:putative nucleotidyltransferase with HDIG domain